MILLRFSRGTGFAGAVVRAATWSWCSHVGFKLDNGLVLDATPEYGVTVRDAKDDDSTRYFRPLAPASHVARALQWAHGQVGKPYDWTAIFGMTFRRDWHTDKSGWFCSEFVCQAFEEAGWCLVRDSGQVDRITPRDLLLSTALRPVDVGVTNDDARSQPPRIPRAIHRGFA